MGKGRVLRVGLALALAATGLAGCKRVSAPQFLYASWPPGVGLDPGPIKVPELPIEDDAPFDGGLNQDIPVDSKIGGLFKDTGLPPLAAALAGREFVIDNGSVDPMVAVGKDHVVATDGGTIYFLTKSGLGAGTPLPPSGNVTKTVLPSSEFFSQLWLPKTPSGGENKSSINRHLGFPDDDKFKCDPDADVVTENADGTFTPTVSPCVNEFYDNKVVYDGETGRFVILSSSRNRMWTNADPGSSAAGCFPPAAGADDDEYTRCLAFPRRYFAIAVSKGEDPRQGFHQWIVTDSNYSDGQVMAVANGYLLVTVNGPTPQAGAEDGEALLYAISMADLADGDPSPAARAWGHSFFGDAVSVRPVMQVGQGDGMAYVLARSPRPDGEGPVQQRIYGLPEKTGTGWPSLSSASVELAAPLGLGSHDLPAYAAGRIFAVDVYPNPQLRLTRIPVNRTENGFTASNLPADGFADVEADDSASGGALTAAVPAIGLTPAGHAAVVYRLSNAAAGTHQVVVRAFRANEAAWRGLRTVADGTGTAPRADFSAGAFDGAGSGRIWLAHRYVDPSAGVGIVVASVLPV